MYITSPKKLYPEHIKSFNASVRGTVLRKGVFRNKLAMSKTGIRYIFLERTEQCLYERSKLQPVGLQILFI
jgi:hypothetical protein